MAKVLTKEMFIEKARSIHGNKYDYSKAEYKNSHTPVCIICPEHGEFWQVPYAHLNGSGCKKCGNERVATKLTFSSDQFLERAKKVHGDKYDYSKVEYKNANTKVCIICPKHGEFFMTPHQHLNGQGCKLCAREKLGKERTKPTEVWVEEVRKIHGDRYSYEKTIYRGHRRKVTITCPIHGDFEQLAYDHRQGKGCPKCRRSWIENDIEDWLKENGLKYITQYRPKFLVDGKSHFSLDFFLPDYGVAIECHGAQHFIGHTFYSKKIEDVVRRDKRKKQLCDENGIKILYYTNLNGELEYFEPVIRDKTKLLIEIKNGH